MSISAPLRAYSGGGYVMKLKGYIGDMREKIQMLQREKWVDNRTRALIVEFSVYNAQVGAVSLLEMLPERKKRLVLTPYVWHIFESTFTERSRLPLLLLNVWQGRRLEHFACLLMALSLVQRTQPY